MHVIVPLAGPEMVRADGEILALMDFQGHAILKHALSSRPWSSSVKNYSFVLYECEETKQFADRHLRRWYKDCSIVYLSSFSRGAAMSALAGIPLLDSFCQPVIIDLADILYSCNIDIAQSLASDKEIGGIAITFTSKSPKYSYLASDPNGRVTRAAEKEVISYDASVGTYIFRDCAVFLKAIAHAIEHESSQTYDGLFYVCPLFNGVLAQGKEVILARSDQVIDIKARR